MKRSPYFAYGVACHLLFLGTFAYMAAFVGKLFVPKSIDSAPAGPVAAAVVEERDLVFHFGRQYEDYRRRVPMFVPSLKRLPMQPVIQSDQSVPAAPLPTPEACHP